jgi:hypothetical protein
MDTTRHAAVRSKQRGIPPLMIDLLREFGARQPAGQGAQKVFFDKVARRRLRAYAGPMAPLLEQHLDVYAVMSNSDEVITVAHRTARINRQ